MKKICFIGAGKMAEALIHSVIRSGIKTRIIATDIETNRLKYISKKFPNIETTSNNTEAIKKSDIVFLCVKPQQMEELLKEIKSSVTAKHLIISIAAGVTLRFIEEYLKTARVIRTMPNTPIMVGCGVVCYTLGSRATKKDSYILEELLKKTAILIKLPEKLINSATAISGSGPAYIFYVAEILNIAAKKVGFDEKTARTLVFQMIKGASEMLTRCEASPEVLRANVTSPGGTTQVAVNYLEKNNFKEVLISAVLKARRRAEELSH